MSEERTYTIPLRKDFIKVPRYYRAKRAVNQVKGYISKHMKVENVKIGRILNEEIWADGIRNPPGKVTVKAIKDGNTAKVELEGHAYKVEKVQTEKTEQPSTLKDKLAAKMGADKEEPAEEKEEGKKAEEKPEEAPKQEEKEGKPESKPAAKKKSVKKATAKKE